MQLFISVIILFAFLCGALLIIRNQESSKRVARGVQYTEYRTDFALDECLDKLRAPCEDDIFTYTCTREMNGSFSLHFTLHRETQQPVDTLYALRLEAGRQTVISLVFIRESFGYQEPVFPQEVLDNFFLQKLNAKRIAL